MEAPNQSEPHGSNSAEFTQKDNYLERDASTWGMVISRLDQRFVSTAETVPPEGTEQKYIFPVLLDDDRMTFETLKGLGYDIHFVMDVMPEESDKKSFQGIVAVYMSEKEYTKCGKLYGILNPDSTDNEKDDPVSIEALRMFYKYREKSSEDDKIHTITPAHDAIVKMWHIMGMLHPTDLQKFVADMESIKDTENPMITTEHFKLDEWRITMTSILNQKVQASRYDEEPAWMQEGFQEAYNKARSLGLTAYTLEDIYGMIHLAVSEVLKEFPELRPTPKGDKTED